MSQNLHRRLDAIEQRERENRHKPTAVTEIVIVRDLPDGEKERIIPGLFHNGRPVKYVNSKYGGQNEPESKQAS